MSTGLGQQIFDAILRGDSAEAERIKDEIEANQQKINEAYSSRNRGDIALIQSHIINNPGTPTPQVYDYLEKEVNDDWWEWELDTIFKIVEDKIKTKLHPVMRDKISALRHLCNRAESFDDWYMFNQLALSFSGSDFENVKFASPGAVINAVKVMNYVRPEMDADFGDEVIKFIIVVLKNDGIYTPPPSVMHYIGREMAHMVDKDTVRLWVDAHKKLSEGNFEDDSPESIQAMRMYRAEKASDRYFSNDITKD